MSIMSCTKIYQIAIDILLLYMIPDCINEMTLAILSTCSLEGGGSNPNLARQA